MLIHTAVDDEVHNFCCLMLFDGICRVWEPMLACFAYSGNRKQHGLAPSIPDRLGTVRPAQHPWPKPSWFRSPRHNTSWSPPLRIWGHGLLS